METDELEFLQQSNYIERVADSQSFDDAVTAWKYLKKQKEMTIQVVLKTHALLMVNQNIPYKDIGNFRNVEVVTIYKGVKTPTLSWLVVKERMDIWVKNSWLFPKNWKKHHIEYEKIHPFIDGNGRTGRMFMNWERLKAGLPILVIKEEDRFNYYKWFKKHA